MTWLTPIIGLMILCASLGGMLTWLAGPSKGLLLIGRREGYLPPFLQQMNKHGIQQNILVTQGFLTTVIALLYAFIPDVSSAYWIFSVMTTQVYLVMYVLMLFAAMKLRKNQAEHPRGFKAPVLTLLCFVGMAASVAAFFIGFVPPSQFENGSTATYIAIVGGGVLLIGFVVPGVTYALRKPNWKTEDVGEEDEPEGIPEPMAAATQDVSPDAPTPTPIPAEEPQFNPEQHPTPDPHPERRKWIYGGIGLVLGGLLVWGLIALPERNKGEEAQAKAGQVIQQFEAQGLTPPDQDLLVNLLGTDGGNVCTDPASALNEAMHRISLANGAAQVGVRPVTVDSKVVQGELIILDVYCPDKAQQARQYLDSLDYDDVINQ
jgi:hypothetical protein